MEEQKFSCLAEERIYMEELKELGYEPEESSSHFILKGAHRNDVFPWRISKKLVYEMDKRDWGALKDIVRIICRGRT